MQCEMQALNYAFFYSTSNNINVYVLSRHFKGGRKFLLFVYLYISLYGCIPDITSVFCDLIPCVVTIKLPLLVWYVPIQRRNQLVSISQGTPFLNTFAASYLNTQGLNSSCLKSPVSTLVDLIFQSRALRSFSLNQLRNLSLQAGHLHSSFSISS